MPKKTNEEWAAKLTPLSKDARRNITGDVEWSASQFRKFINDTRALCDVVDAFILEQANGGFVVNERVRVKANGVEGKVTAPWYRGGVWVNDLGPYDPDELERSELERI